MFVHGTLKPGRSRWHALAAFVATGADLRETTVRGSLWDSGHDWPALSVGTADVPGVLVPLDPARAADALVRLDVIEGVASGLFERVRVRTAEGETCWVYRWPHSTAGLIRVPNAW